MRREEIVVSNLALMEKPPQKSRTMPEFGFFESLSEILQRDLSTTPFILATSTISHPIPKIMENVSLEIS